MGWSHCEVAEIADTVACPACGVSKAAWTLKVDATRTFTVARKTKKREKTAWVEVELPGAAGAQVEVETPDGQLLARTLDGAGVVRFDALYPEPVRVRFPDRARARCEGAELDADGWTTCEPGRRHRFVPPGPAASGPRATFVWPPAGEHRQYVNLARTQDQPERGNVIQLRLAGSDGSAGQHVHLRAVRRPGHSLRDDLRPGTSGGRSLTEAALEVRLSPTGEAVVEVELGHAGGDVLQLDVGASPDVADERLTITNWRRIDYQVTQSASSPPVDITAMHAVYERVFIQLVPRPRLMLTEDDPRLPPGTWVEAQELETGSNLRPGKRLVVGKHNQAKFLNLVSPGEASTFHFIFVDAIFDATNDALEPHTLTVGPFRVEKPESPGGVDGHTPEVTGTIFKTDLTTGGSSLLSGTWRSLAPHGHRDFNKHGSVEPGDLTIRFGRKVLVRGLQGIVPGPGGPGPDPHPVEVTLEFRVAIAGGAGRSIGHAQALIVNQPDAWQFAVCVHELGHALGQAGKRIAPGLDAATHGRFFIERGYSGPHCADGIPEGAWSGGTLKGKRGATCVMWGEARQTSAPHDGGNFCGRCRPFVLADDCLTFVG